MIELCESVAVHLGIEPEWTVRAAEGVGFVASDLGTWLTVRFFVEAMGIEPTNLLHAMQALYQLSYAPRRLAEPSISSRVGKRTE